LGGTQLSSGDNYRCFFIRKFTVRVNYVGIIVRIPTNFLNYGRFLST
jgi:hypothetical protein